MEIVRRAVRGILRPDSKIYTRLAGVADLVATVRSDGYGTWKTLERLRKANPGGKPAAVTFRNLAHPVFIRPGTRDAHTVINNVVREEYGLTDLGSPTWMIDAGAYTGDTTAYFLSKYPGLKSIALEPNPPSHAMAEINLQPYGTRAILLKKGLFTTEGAASFSGESTGASISDTGFSIDCTTIPSLIQQYNIPRIDLLKMDIEGAEEAIFSNNPGSWIDRVGLLIIEIHCPLSNSAIPAALAKHGFSMTQYRSVWYCRRVKS